MTLPTYRVYGPDDFYTETESQDEAFRTARDKAVSSGQMVLVSFTWRGRYNMRHFYSDGTAS